MPIFDYKCVGCGVTDEKLIPIREERLFCVFCNDWTVYPLLSAPMIKLDGTDPSFPTAWNSWPKKREQKMKQEAKQED